jgi:hypothetical protein
MKRREDADRVPQGAPQKLKVPGCPRPFPLPRHPSQCAIRELRARRRGHVL